MGVRRSAKGEGNPGSSRGRRSSGSRTEAPGSRESAPVALATPLELRASRPADVRLLPRMHALIDFAIHQGDLCSFRGAAHLEESVRERRVVLAFSDAALVAFAAATPYQADSFVGHSAVVLDPSFRGHGLDERVKERLVRLSRRRWPEASMVSLTLASTVERLEKGAGFEPVPYCDLTDDTRFWNDCEGCVHFGHLKRNQLQDCHCWAGLLPAPGARRELVIPKDALLRPRPGARYRSV